MIFQIWASAIQQSLYTMLYGVVTFIPNLLLAIIIFVIGWFIGVWLGWVIAQAVRALKVDHALRSAGVDSVVARAGYRLDSGAFLGALVKWFVIAVFLVASLQVLGLTQVNLFLQAVVLSYMPRVIIAVLIILVAAVIADAVQGMVVGTARAAGVKSAGFAGTVARWAIWIFAILAALDQLGVTPFIQTLFTGVVVALSLAFGLAFGLGGQDAAARAIERARNEMKRSE
jgi:hypothetical protein